MPISQNPFDPNAPAINQDFSHATTNTKPEPEKTKETDILTRAELNAKLEQRPEPQQDLQLTPSGVVEKTVHKEVDKENEARIAKIQQAFDLMSQNLEQDFEKSR